MPEAIALNCLEEVEESSEAGHPVQLQLAAHAAFGKAKGKGKGRSKKGKGKGKGKVIRSHWTEQRREKLKSLKAKSKCMRCGALGHWAGDPECKFPTSQGGGKGKAHLAVIADEGLSIPAKNDSAAAFVARAKSSAASSAAAPKPIAAPAREPREMVMEGGGSGSKPQVCNRAGAHTRDIPRYIGYVTGRRLSRHTPQKCPVIHDCTCELS